MADSKRVCVYYVGVIWDFDEKKTVANVVLYAAFIAF